MYFMYYICFGYKLIFPFINCKCPKASIVSCFRGRLHDSRFHRIMATKPGHPAGDHNTHNGAQHVLIKQPTGLRFIALHNPRNICYLNSTVQLIWLTTGLRAQVLACSDTLIHEAVSLDATLLHAAWLVRKLRVIFAQALATTTDEIRTFDLRETLKDWARIKPDGEKVTLASYGDVTLPFVKILTTLHQIVYREGTNITRCKGGICINSECPKKLQSIIVTTEPEMSHMMSITLPSSLPSSLMSSRTTVTPFISSRLAAATLPAESESVYPLTDLLRTTSVFAKDDCAASLLCSHCPCSCGRRRTSSSCNCGAVLTHSYIQSKLVNKSEILILQVERMLPGKTVATLSKGEKNISVVL